jgi:diketogulonate reductase-like aldo/keto reductase
MYQFSSPISIPDLMQRPVVARIAKKHNKTNAQILLKYLMELGIAVIPKSVNPERILANFQVQSFPSFLLLHTQKNVGQL